MSQFLTPVPQTAPTAKINTLALISLIIALAPIILIFIPVVNCLVFFCPIAAIILGVIGLNQINKTLQGGKGMAIAGIIIGGISIVLFILLIVLLINGVSLLGPVFDNIFRQIQNSLGGSAY